MTISTYTGLNTALSGLEAMQAGIDTTGENIANASTPGYTEQVVDLGESSPISIADGYEADGGYQLGTGVDVDGVTRQRNAFLDVQYRTQNTQASNASTLASQLGDVQTAIGSSATSGVGAALTSFYNAWSTLASNPTSSSAAQAVVSDGQALAQQFNAVSGQISTVQSQAQAQYTALTASPSGEVQQYATQIAQLNGQIASAQSQGLSANTLEDARDTAIDNLSALAQVSVTTQTNGTDTISFGDAATPLVSGTTVTWPQTLTSAAGGQLGALQSLASSTGPIGTLSSSLDSVASSVISQVNSLQPSSPFFSGNSASTIAVTATASTVQASSAGSSNSGDLASQIAAGGDSATNSYATFIGQLGSAVQAANNTNTTSQSLLTSVSNQRQSVSGVSLDQEMTNLITYQQGYQASARMMSTMQSVIQTLISSVGGAGL